VWVILRWFIPNALELAAVNAHDRHPELHYETSDDFPSEARGLGTRSMMQSAVHGSSNEGSIRTRWAAPPSRRLVAVKRTHNRFCENQGRAGFSSVLPSSFPEETLMKCNLVQAGQTNDSKVWSGKGGVFVQPRLHVHAGSRASKYNVRHRLIARAATCQLSDMNIA
jgi:hypothetical protein